MLPSRFVRRGVLGPHHSCNVSPQRLPKPSASGSESNFKFYPGRSISRASKGTHHRGAFNMYLAGLISSTFVLASRPAANVELVELTLENEYLPPKPVERHKEFRKEPNGQLNSSIICNYGDSNHTQAITEAKKANTSIVPATSNRKFKERRKRRISLEDLPADLYMEPLNPLLLQLPEGGDAASLGAEDNHRVRSSPEGTSACVLRKLGLEEQDLDQEWSFWMSNMAHTDRTIVETETESNMAIVNVTSKLGSPLLLSRVHHHPLEVTEEVQEHRLSDADVRTDIGSAQSFRESCDEIKRNIAREASLPRTDEAFARILQILEKIEESESAKRQKSSTGIVGAGEVATHESYGHEGQCALEPHDRQGGDSREQGASLAMSSGDAESLNDVRRPILSPMPSLSSPVMEKLSFPPMSPVPSLLCPMFEKSSPSVSSSGIERSPSRPISPLPSFSSPMMETMQAGNALTELLHSWNDKVRNPPKLAMGSMGTEPVREEKVLWYSSPRRTEEDIQADLSFRRWRWESPPDRELTSDFEDLQELDIGAPVDDANMRNQEFASTNLTNFEAFLNLRTFDLSQGAETENVDSDAQNRKDGSRSDYPSPSSFICRLSPTSLFSDDQEPFHLSLSPFNDKFAYFPQARKEASTFNVSPRSVLPQESEVSQFVSRDSEMRNKTRKAWDSSCQLYDYESSDLETPRKTGFREQTFPRFTYNVPDKMSETPSGGNLYDACYVTSPADLYQQHSSSPELNYFQEAEQREPWLDELDDTDLEFLFPLDFSNKYRNMIRAIPEVREEVLEVDNPYLAQKNRRKLTEDIATTVPAVRKEVSEVTNPKQAQGSARKPTEDIVTTVPKVCKEDSDNMSPSQETTRETTNLKAWVPYVASQLHESYSPPIAIPIRRGMPSPRRLKFQEKSSEVFIASLYRGISLEKQSSVEPKVAPKRRVNFASDLVKEIPIPASNFSSRISKPTPLPLPLPRADEKLDHEYMPLNLRNWKIEEDGPSILSRRRWGSSFRDIDETAATLPGKAIQAGSGETLKNSRRAKGRQAMPFCAGRLFAWPQRFGLKTSKGRPTESSDEESVAGDDYSFGRLARRDGDTIRKILKGSQKKYASLTIADVLKQDL